MLPILQIILENINSRETKIFFIQQDFWFQSQLEGELYEFYVAFYVNL